MIIISHRGNLNGPNPKLENSPDYILLALSEGYDVEIDVWCIEDQWFLGHDIPQYHIPLYFLFNDRLWCHAKNFEALKNMLLLKYINCFWHNQDDYTITSKGYIWVYPGKQIDSKGILVVQGDTIPSDFNAQGICTDYPSKLKTI